MTTWNMNWNVQTFKVYNKMIISYYYYLASTKLRTTGFWPSCHLVLRRLASILF